MRRPFLRAFFDEVPKAPSISRSLIPLAVFTVFAFLFYSGIAASMAKTTDEGYHLDYGKRILQLQPGRLSFHDDSTMPVSALNALPMRLANVLDGRHAAPSLVLFLRGLDASRLGTILATLVLIFVIYLWSRELYGPLPALVSAVLAMLSPNIAAHGTLVTTDLYFTLGIVAALFYLRRYLLQPTLQNAATSAFVLALSQVSKSFAIFLYGAAALFLVLFAIPFVESDPVARQNPKRIATYGILAFSFFVIVVNVSFCFDRSFTKLADYRFESVAFNHLRQLPIVNSLRVPLPYPFLQGLDMMEHDEQSGTSFGNVYLLGHLRRGEDFSFHGFKSYYVVALFFKEPIPVQILSVIGFILIIRQRSLHDFLTGEALLLVPIVVLLIWMSFFNRAQIGVRQVLPACAVDVIIGSAAFVSFSSKTLLRQLCLCCLVVWLTASVASYYPHMIPYMNEFVLDRKMSYKILADSNLDWGQNAFVVREFLSMNPDVIENPSGPVAGRLLVRANLLVGVPRQAPNQMAWLRSRYKPVSQVGYSDFLFVVPAGDIQGNSIKK